MLWCKSGSIHDDRLVPRSVLVRIDDSKRLFCMPLTKNQCLLYFGFQLPGIASDSSESV